jgi:hypothetical protein
MCARPFSFGWGIVGTGEEELCTSGVDAMVLYSFAGGVMVEFKGVYGGWWLFPF